MAFDRNDTADVTALATELQNARYSGLPTSTILALLNDPAQNPGSETGVPLLTAQILMTVMDAAEFAALTAGQRDYLGLLLHYGLNGGDLEPMKPTLASIFPAGSDTRGAFQALSRPISRAEVLWGIDTIITREDYAAAVAL